MFKALALTALAAVAHASEALGRGYSSRGYGQEAQYRGGYGGHGQADQYSERQYGYEQRRIAGHGKGSNKSSKSRTSVRSFGGGYGLANGRHQGNGKTLQGLSDHISQYQRGMEDEDKRRGYDEPKRSMSPLGRRPPAQRYSEKSYGSRTRREAGSPD